MLSTTYREREWMLISDQIYLQSIRNIILIWFAKVEKGALVSKRDKLKCTITVTRTASVATRSK